jgi:hypothetical protein
VRILDRLTRRSCSLNKPHCLGLELDDPGFDFSVLSEFRSRPIDHGLDELEIFNGGGYDGAVTAAAGRAMPQA